MDINEFYDVIKTNISEIKEDIKYIRNVSIPHIHQRIDELTSKSNGIGNNKYIYQLIGILIAAIIVLATGKVLSIF